MKKILLFMMTIFLTLGMVGLPAMAEGNESPIVTASFEENTGNILIGSTDKEYLSAVKNVFIIDESNCSNFMGFTFDGDKIVVDYQQLFLNNIGNGNYTISLEVADECGYLDTTGIPVIVNFKEPSSPVSISMNELENVIEISCDDLDYLEAFMNNGYTLSFQQGSISRHISCSNVTLDTSAKKITASLATPLSDGGYYRSILGVLGYEIQSDILFYPFSKTVGELHYSLTYTESGDLIIQSDNDSWLEGIVTPLNNGSAERATCGLLFVNENAEAFPYVARGGSYDGSFDLDTQNNTVTIKADYLTSKGVVTSGNYYIAVRSSVAPQSAFYPVLISLKVNKNVPNDLKAVYDATVGEVIITSESDPSYVDNINLFYFEVGENMYMIDGADVENGRVSYQTLKNLNGGNSLKTGSYDFYIKSTGYVDAPSNNSNGYYLPRLTITPYVDVAENPVSGEAFETQLDVTSEKVSGDLEDNLVSILDDIVNNLEELKQSGKISEEMIDTLTETGLNNVISAKVVSSDATEAEQNALKENVSDRNVEFIFDLSVMLSVDGTLQTTATINNVDKPIQFTLEIPSELLEIPAGQTRSFFVERMHNGELTCFEVTVNSAGKVSFESDLYSTYALSYKDTAIAVTGVTLDVNEKALKTGESFTLNPNVAPSDANNKELSWASSDATVAEVVNGVVTAKKAGTATITVTTVDGNFSAECTVSVVDPETKLEMDDLSTVPTELVSKYETVEKLEEKMIAVLGEKSSITKENTAVYDVTLMVTFDGVNYVEADETHWPADGKIHVVLPYPEGADKTYEFTVAHMFTKSLFGKTAGDIEYPAVTLTENGIEFDVTGLSPISLGWKKEVAPTLTPTPTPEVTPSQTPTSTPVASTVPNTSDNSHMMMWALLAIVSLIAAIAMTAVKKFQIMK